MINLAGRPREENDIQILAELTEAGIDWAISYDLTGEVPYSRIGLQDDCIYYRRWYYYHVDCLVPLAIAEKLYVETVGRKDVRVTGDCTCPAPKGNYLTYFDEQGFKLINYADVEKDLPTLERLGIPIPENWKLVPDKTVGSPYVENYHIDSVEGLKLFADAMRGQRRPLKPYIPQLIHR